MPSDTFPRLLGDVGGTHARFAWQARAGEAASEATTYLCAQHESLLEVIRHYLAEHTRTAPRGCAIGIANPVVGDRVQMTNHHWSFSIAQLQRDLGVQRLAVINDFTAIAWSLPTLTPADLHQVGSGAAQAGSPLAVLGPGTGLGVSGLMPATQGGFVAINGEGGHVSLAADNPHEAAVLDWLKRRFGHASAERAVSGPGLVNLYEAGCELAGVPARPLTPAEVLARARDRTDPRCASALDLFCGFLGSAAGNLALTLGARGGVFVGGGIAPRMIDELRRSSFRERFEGKGRFRAYLASIPTQIIDAATPAALRGAALALDMEP